MHIHKLLFIFIALTTHTAQAILSQNRPGNQQTEIDTRIRETTEDAQRLNALVQKLGNTDLPFLLSSDKKFLACITAGAFSVSMLTTSFFTRLLGGSHSNALFFGVAAGVFCAAKAKSHGHNNYKRVVTPTNELCFAFENNYDPATFGVFLAAIPEREFCNAFANLRIEMYASKTEDTFFQKIVHLGRFTLGLRKAQERLLSPEYKDAQEIQALSLEVAPWLTMVEQVTSNVVCEMKKSMEISYTQEDESRIEATVPGVDFQGL